MTAGVLHAEEPADGLVRELAEQNQRLQQQVREQQRVIDELGAKMKELLRVTDRHERDLDRLRERTEEAPAPAAPSYRREQEVRISGEAGLAFFSTGRGGAFPKSEFRVDEAKLFIEAPIVKDTYFFAELDLMLRESNDEFFALGELYVDFENVSGRLGGPARLVNLRAGRLDIPFGEEYLRRGPFTNPLISHSLSDVWGVDEGVEIYGSAGAWDYVLAVQNGGNSKLHDFNSDKQIVARLGWRPAGWLHLGASALRTGELNTNRPEQNGDVLSEVWFGNGFFRSIGSTPTTGAFWATLAEVNAVAHWPGGRLTATVGQARYGDNDRAADNSRRLRYGYVEAEQSLGEALYGAARYSAIRAPRGYPLVGWGNMGANFFSALLSEDLTRLSLGFGYRLGPPIVLKLEYAWESGRYTTGARRHYGNFFGSEIGLKF